MEVPALAKKILADIGLLMTKAKDIEQRYDDGEQIAKAEIHDITRDLREQEKIANKLVEKIHEREPYSLDTYNKELSDLTKKVNENRLRIFQLEEIIRQKEEENRQKDDQIARVNEDLQEFKNTVQNQFQEIKNALHRGQLAYNFEKIIAKFIYPSGTEIPTQKIFTSMKEWLLKNQHTPHGREANKKWNKLVTEFSWSKAHERVFFKLVRCRLKYAHPNVDVGLIESEMFSDEEKECINVIVKMTDRVNDLVKGKHHY